jgi:hypothetical protein
MTLFLLKLMIQVINYLCLTQIIHKIPQALQPIEDYIKTVLYQQFDLCATDISIIKSDQMTGMQSPRHYFESLVGYETQSNYGPLICLYAVADQVAMMIEGTLIRISRGTLLILPRSIPHKGLSCGDVTPTAGEGTSTILPIVKVTPHVGKKDLLSGSFEDHETEDVDDDVDDDDDDDVEKQDDENGNKWKRSQKGKDHIEENCRCSC